jgi:DNA-binding LacI/PurR family transcriptional regulator
MTVAKVVRWIEKDMRERQLDIGQAYLTASQMSEILSVSRATADRALRELSHRRVLVRKQRKGTFVGEAYADGAFARPRLDEIHVLSSAQYLRSGLVPVSTIVEELERALGGAAVNLHFIPEASALAFVDRLVKRIMSVGESAEGLVLIRCPREAQLLVEASGIPSVVFGSVYPDVKRLSWIDVDQHGAGRIAARHALDQGFKRFTLLMRDQWRRGDNLMMQGLTVELARARMRFDDLRIESIPQDSALIEEQIGAVLDQADEPTALLCRNAVFADIAHRLAAGHDRRNGTRTLVVATQARREGARYARAAPDMEPAEQIQWVGRRLARLADDPDAPPENMVVPVRLVVADNLRGR